MLTILYCDASWYTDERCGGWGVWLKSDQGRVVTSGVIPAYVGRSHEAELAAIFAGIYLAMKEWPNTSRIIVRNDCGAALNLMAGKQLPKPRHVGAIRLIEKIDQFRPYVKLIPRWVKGHQNTGTTEAWLNQRVDRMARLKAKIALEQVRQLSSAQAPTPAIAEPSVGT